MRILVFSWRDPKHPLAGGAEQVMHEHAKGWIRRGHKVTLFSSQVNGLANWEKLDGVEIIRDGYQYLGVQLAGFLYYLKNGNNFDFVVDQFHGLPFFTPLYVRKPKVAVIQETAGKVWFLNPLFWPLNWIVGLTGYFLEPVIFLFYKRVPFMVGSASTKDDMAAFGIPKKNIAVVPHGVIVERPKPMPSKEKIPTITFLGVLSRDKGIEDAIKVFSIINEAPTSLRPGYLLPMLRRERNPSEAEISSHSSPDLRPRFSAKGDKMGKFQFWVIGKADKESYLKKVKTRVKEAGLTKFVKFWGFVDQEQKFKLLARSRVLLNPSMKEGWGLVNIEANCMGTPVVGYRVQGTKDSVADAKTGFLSKFGDIRGLASNVLKLVDDQELYAKIRKNALKWSENFEWKKARVQSLELIESIWKK